MQETLAVKFNDCYNGIVPVFNTNFRMGNHFLKEENIYEACKNRKSIGFKIIPEGRRMRGMPDLMPVGLQDIMHRGESSLPEGE